MPPSRRHTRTTTPPVRRPRVAGLRRPGTQPEKRPAPEPTVEVEPAPVEVTEPTVEAEHPRTEFVNTPVIGAPDTEEPALTEPEDTEPEDTPATEPSARAPRSAKSRPTGKRRPTGSPRPDDLEEAEAAAEPTEPGRPPRDTTLGWAVAIGVLAVIVAVVAVVFHGAATRRSEGADVNNRALTDPATQSEVIRQVRTALEKALSYNYTDLDGTARAVQENLAGKALCEHEQLFGQVRKVAPEQKLVLSTQVREIGVSRLEGDRAFLLVFLDQRTTRVDQNQTTASGAQLGVHAQRQDDRWKVTQFDMLSQPLPNGQQAPQC